MRRVLIGLALLVGMSLFVAGCGGSGSGAKATAPPNADQIKVDMKNPGAALPPPPGTPGVPVKK